MFPSQRVVVTVFEAKNDFPFLYESVFGRFVLNEFEKVVEFDRLDEMVFESRLARAATIFFAPQPEIEIKSASGNGNLRL